jgi:hypothetical protein
MLALNPSVLNASPTGGNDVGIPREEAAPPILVGIPNPDAALPILVGIPKPEVAFPMPVGNPIVFPIPLKFKLAGLDIGFVIFKLGAVKDFKDKFGAVPVKKLGVLVPTLTDGALKLIEGEEKVVDDNDTDGAFTTDSTFILSSQKYSTA